MRKYIAQDFEKKWQEIWEKEGIYHALNQSKKPKKYILDMFPYPSGDGLHVGHFKGYTATDILSRYFRMRGYNVLHPMGWDAFGLPAENYAIKTGVHPKITTAQNIKNIKAQMKQAGLSYDWSREIDTTDPNYYKWTQWIFIQLFKHGLAYEAEAPINWCPKDKTGLANEEVVNGKCERCGTEVETKNIRQWILGITKYADRLLEDLDGLDWPKAIVDMQRNWIGRKKGINIRYEVVADELSIEDHKDRHSELEEVQWTSESESSRVGNDSLVGGSRNKFGMTVKNNFKAEDLFVECFTTRPDTNFGATFIVLGPEHPLIQKITLKKYLDPVKRYQEETLKKTEIERMAEGRKKTGVFTGNYAINSLTGKKMPIWVSDFVLGNVGTGAVVGVPAHDERDYDFAKAFDLEIIPVISDRHPELVSGSSISMNSNQPWKVPTRKSTGLPPVQHDTNKKDQLPYEDEGFLINSGQFTGLSSEEAREKIMDYLVEKGWGKKVTSYHLRDWIFSRQRYWGEPIPLVHCQKCGIVPIPESELPLKLPELEKFEPSGTGESPLLNAKDWVATTCPTCSGTAKRETNTMPQWAGSCWYYLRFCDPTNNHELITKNREAYWLPVDWYVGGAEHAVLHLLYARFWHKFLFDLGVIQTNEPFYKLRNVGLVIAPDGQKMSKSRGNVIRPDDIISEYGADTLRMYEMFMGPFDNSIAWDPGAINGIYRYLTRVWEVVLKKGSSRSALSSDKNTINRHAEFISASSRVVEAPEFGGSRNEFGMTDKNTSNYIDQALNKLIKKVGDDIEQMKFNTAIASMMEFINLVYHKPMTNDQKLGFLKLLAPFAPHIAEELWQEIQPSDSLKAESESVPPSASWRTNGLKSDDFLSVHKQEWPTYGEITVPDEQVTIVIQVNGKVRDSINISKDIKEDELRSVVLKREKIKKYLEDREVKKFIYITGRIISIVI